MLNLRQLQDKKIELASAKHSEMDIESEGKVLNLRRLQNRKIFVTSERSSGKSVPAPDPRVCVFACFPPILPPGSPLC